jgi:hypothetical protein
VPILSIILTVATLAMGTARIQRLSLPGWVESGMPRFFRTLAGSIVLVAALAEPAAAAAGQQPARPGSYFPAEAQQLLALANQSRAAAGVGPLQWDPALAAAALEHCQRMAAAGPIAHQYSGELELTVRARSAGAHFSLIEENVAFGTYIAAIHQGWLKSPGHRANLLNPEVDAVGIAVVPGRGAFYVVADYARAVPVLSREQIEATVAKLISPSGLFIVPNPADARAYCATGSQPSSSRGFIRSAFLMVWEDSDISTLPRDLAGQVASGRYHSAVVGACTPKDAESGFTSYRIAAILF